MSALPLDTNRKPLTRNLAAMMADGVAFSVMVGISETWLPAFVLARGMSPLVAGLIATVPLLLGSVLQLMTPLLLRRFGSPRRFVVSAAATQAGSLLGLVAMALVPSLPDWLVFVPATIYWAAGLSTGPAWNTWVEALVPAHVRAGFFARRSRLCHLGVLTGLVAGGLMLRGSAPDRVLVCFAGLFGVGTAARGISAAMLACQTDVRLSPSVSLPPVSGGSLVRWIDSLRASVQRPGPAGRLVLFLLAVQTAVNISGPYFTPFMLKSLELPWLHYMLLLSLGFAGKMLSLPWAGRFVNRAGPDWLLWIGSLGIIPISALWMVSQSLWYLCCVQLLSGLVWGCYELAMLLQFFRRIPAERRVAILTIYNLGNSAAMVAGSLIGAVILRQLGETRTAFLTVFVVSSAARALALLVLPGRRFALQSTRVAVRTWVSRTIAVRLNGGTLERPIFAAMDADSTDEDNKAVNTPTP